VFLKLLDQNILSNQIIYARVVSEHDKLEGHDHRPSATKTLPKRVRLAVEISSIALKICEY
jgi:hypothetical protein